MTARFPITGNGGTLAATTGASRWLPAQAGGGESPENTGARPPHKSGFFHARSTRLPESMAARVGVPSGTPVPVFRSLNPATGRHPRLRAWAAVEIDRNTGAITMAGNPTTPTGHIAPTTTTTRPQRIERSNATTRSRRIHGIAHMGTGWRIRIASLRSRPRYPAARVVHIEVSCDAGITLAAALTAADARELGRILIEAGNVSALVIGGAA